MCAEKKVMGSCGDSAGQVNSNKEWEKEEREQSCDQKSNKQGDADCCKHYTELQDKYAHVVADLHNFRQRVERERMQWSMTAQIEVIKKLLPIVDDFDRATQEMAKSDSESQLAVGFGLIHKHLLKMLASSGVEPITDVAVFDPAKHEAIMQVDVPNYMSGAIVAVLEKGYMFKNEVIRPAKVSVAQ